MRGIDPVNIERRIGFGKALGLRIGKNLRKIQPVALHSGQDEITCAIENAVDPVNAVGGGTIAQTLNDRNTSGNGRFKFERGLLALRQSRKLETMMRDHRLVGGHQSASVGQSLTGQGQGRAIGSPD